MPNLEPFTLKEPSIEEVSKRLSSLYSNVFSTRDPMFSWIQIINDVTILGESLRRGRESEAIDRASKVLWRLLEFIGYYTYIHKPANTGDGETLGDMVARLFRLPSSENLININILKEGPTRWILAKYPFACSKCGLKPCTCLIWPWVLEDRREKPEDYLKIFVRKAEEARNKLKNRKLREFSIQDIIYHFRSIYQGNYYHQDPWKIGMHLSEEFGEATIELGRINLALLAKRNNFNIPNLLKDIYKITNNKIERDASRIKSSKYRNIRVLECQKKLDDLKSELKTNPWIFYEKIVSEKFKEEIADIFSWIAAIIIKLDKTLSQFKKESKIFNLELGGGVVVLGCPWCRKPKCSNNCLMTHGFSSEIREKLSQF